MACSGYHHLTGDKLCENKRLPKHTLFFIYTLAFTSMSESRIALHGRSSFLTQLQSQPSATVAHIRQLLANRAKGSRNLELCKQMEWLQQCIQKPEKLSAGTWQKLMRNCGLPSMYMDLVEDNTLLTEDHVCTRFCPP